MKEWTYINESELGHSYYHGKYKGINVEIHNFFGDMKIGLYNKKGNALGEPFLLAAPFAEFHSRYEAIMTVIDDLIKSL